ncbi:DUF4124 domain-containing protein [Stenotrophomonas rhizophila]|uniref:DUF4124 domain-containing protein n=1 Tax=Stenotrophomonas rhizophila TaxID=216778 RepID=UPI00112F4BBD|nr:DUF4124 domain-containing protein [Stenotrophomonas rhizophila]
MALVCAAGALAAAPSAQAQVYKCTGAKGETVYAQQPCGAGAKEVTVRASRAATRTPGEAATQSAVFRSTDLSDASIAERNCMNAARSNIQGPIDRRIETYQRQVAALNQQLGRTDEDALAAATRDAGVRAQIASLEQSISAERRSADSTLTSAQQRCAQQRRDREASIERTYAPVHAPSDTATDGLR